jgi:hypothetical protein
LYVGISGLQGTDNQVLDLSALRASALRDVMTTSKMQTWDAQLNKSCKTAALHN